MRAWENHFGNQPATARNVYDLVGQPAGNVPMSSEFQAVLPGDLADYVSKPGSFTRRLGWALRSHKDTRFGNQEYRVEEVRAAENRVGQWRVVHG